MCVLTAQIFFLLLPLTTHLDLPLSPPPNIGFPNHHVLTPPHPPEALSCIPAPPPLAPYALPPTPLPPPQRADKFAQLKAGLAIPSRASYRYHVIFSQHLQPLMRPTTVFPFCSYHA